jgi:hypothetical protein
MLVELAPDQQVLASKWFVPDEKNAGKVTRGQKVTYVVHGGLDPTYVEDTLGIDVQAERSALLKTVDRLNKFTHVNEDSFGSPSNEVERHVLDACEALEAFLNCADEARRLLCSRVEEQVQNEVIRQTISETILSVDEIATHHSIEDVYVDQVEIIALDSREIHFVASGSVDVTLQWGSNSDLRRGDGAEMSESYPLTCNFVSYVDEPDELEMVEDSLCVDTSSWWEGYYDEGE